MRRRHVGGEAWDGEAAIRRAMRPDETLLWLGRPERPAHGPPIGVPEAYLFAIFCIVVMMVIDRLADGHPFGLADLGKAFVVLMFAAWFAAPALFFRPRRLWRRRMVYAVTDKRALIVEETRRGVRLKAFGPAQIAFVADRDRGDGLRDIVFREGPVLRRVRPDNPIGFLGIGDAAGAARALSALRAAPRSVIPVVAPPAP